MYREALHKKPWYVPDDVKDYEVESEPPHIPLSSGITVLSPDDPGQRTIGFRIWESPPALSRHPEHLELVEDGTAVREGAIFYAEGHAVVVKRHEKGYFYATGDILHIECLNFNGSWWSILGHTFKGEHAGKQLKQYPGPAYFNSRGVQKLTLTRNTIEADPVSPPAAPMHASVEDGQGIINSMALDELSGGK